MSIVLTTTTDRVREITLNRPDVLNAFNNELYTALGNAFADARDDDDVHAVLLTGAGRGFSAGQDLKELADLAGRMSSDSEGPAGSDATSGFPVMFDALLALDKPLIAAVNGVGMGIGFTILAHCDLVLIARSGRLKTPFAELGVAPEAASSLMFPMRYGWQNASRILLAGDWVSADEAVEMGVALRAVDDDALMDDARALAARIATATLPSLRAIKSTMTAPLFDAIQAARTREEDHFRVLLQSFGT